ncbi:MAG: hypothetical protein NVS2B16_00900 [Chloroflexota bacterium]
MRGPEPVSSTAQPSRNTAISPAHARAMPHVATWNVEASRLWGGAAVALSLLALCVRVFQIDRESLWLDEGYTLFFSQLPLKQLFLIGGAHEHPPLYYLIVHVLLAIHHSFLITRYISAISGALSVLVLYALGRRLFGPIAGITAAALLTVSPFQVWWSQDGRAYELAGLLVLLSYLLVFRALDRPARRSWVAYSVVTTLALYTEYTTAFVLLPQSLLFLRARSLGQHRSILASWGLSALLFAPWLTVLSHDAASVATDYWIPMPSWSALQTTVLEFLGLIVPCPKYPCVGRAAAMPVVMGHEAVIASIAIAMGLSAALFALLARRLELSITTLWLVLPFSIVLALATRRSLYVDRVFLDATFAWYLLLGALLVAARRHWQVVLAALVVCCLGLGSLVNLRLVYAEASNPDWRSLARDLHAAYRPGQTVIYNPAVLRTLTGAYLPEGWHPTRQQPLWFHGYLDVPGWQSKYSHLKDIAVHDSRVAPQLRYSHFDTILRNIQLRKAVAGQRHVWLVTQDYSGVMDNRRWLGVHGFHLLLSQIYYGDARLEFWSRDAPASVGPPVVDSGFHAGWTTAGKVVVGRMRVAALQGPSHMAHAFTPAPGGMYVVNVEYRAFPGSFPSVQVRVHDRAGHILGRIINRFGGVLDTFPRTEWYNLPVNGVWLSQPFGFVAPPGATGATITLGNAAGTCLWRNITVRRET